MAEIFDFYVNDDRSITYKLSEPIMLEDNGVMDWRFHIPNTVNDLDATGWQWWLVYVNARNEKYTIPLTLEYDYDRPDAYSIATYTVDYGMSCKVGQIKFSIEAIDTDAGGTILHEWHTKTYSAKVEDTLQGNQIEYEETESDIISALLIAVRTKVNQLVGGATPEPKNYVADMIDPDKVYLYVGSEPDESTGYWYYHNGIKFVPGGVYASGIIVDSVPTQGSSNAVSSGGVWDKTLNVYSERINSDNYQGFGITDIVSMPSNKYAVFYTYPGNAKRITEEMVANLPSYNHAFICVLKTSPATNSYASYIAWGFTSNSGVEAIYVANGKGSTSNTPWVKIWDAGINAETIAQKLDVANASNVSLAYTERINRDNLANYGFNSAVSMPANRYYAILTNPGLSNGIRETDISGLPSYSHNFLTLLKFAPATNPYASYFAWGFSSNGGVEAIYVANGLGSTSNTPWVKIWDKDNNLETHFKSTKKVSIIGDSISSFSGYVPSGYATYYPRQDVTSVDNLWWKIALDKTGMTLLKNASWASSTVAGDDTQGAVVASSDARIVDLADGDTKPDIVIVLIGTNDFGRSYSIGTFTDTDAIPTASNIADFKPAYAKMIGKIHTAYPEAKVFVCTLIPRTFSGGGYPAKDQNNESLYAFNKAIKEVAEMMNCSVIDINMNSGINVDNLPNHFIQETSGSYIHPLASGQALVGEYVARELIKGVTL